ncbi:MAG TPA: peptide chain release factor 2 [Gemmatimonadota bacterium]|nr:peptide chain release factor 2 [Gemmatimonadota bacterium]
MSEAREYQRTLSDLEERLDLLGSYLDLSSRRERIAELQSKSAAPDFWNDNERARAVLADLKQHQQWVEGYDALKAELRDAHEMAELLESGDEQLAEEFESLVAGLVERVERFEFRGMLREADDFRGAILTIHPGAGGTESQDWAMMLLRMYTKWMERNGYKYQIVDIQEGEEAGITRVTVEVEGDYSFGYLKAEKGVHRLVRISPFDANARRHTSFASVFVYPDIADEITVEIQDKDLKVDTYRASGAGGQHVNKTDSAVRITHLPTGIVVQSQAERSQHRNRETAMRLLKARLYQYLKAEREKSREELEAEKKEIAFGSQIRSYVLHPYTMVKDHRTSHETSDIESVLEGDITPFMEEYLRQSAGDRSESRAR